MWCAVRCRRIVLLQRSASRGRSGCFLGHPASARYIVRVVDADVEVLVPETECVSLRRLMTWRSRVLWSCPSRCICQRCPYHPRAEARARRLMGAVFAWRAETLLSASTDTRSLAFGNAPFSGNFAWRQPSLCSSVSPTRFLVVSTSSPFLLRRGVVRLSKRLRYRGGL